MRIEYLNREDQNGIFSLPYIVSSGSMNVTKGLLISKACVKRSLQVSSVPKTLPL